MDNLSDKMLAKSDVAFLSEMNSVIQENWEKRQRYRTETEMRISVLNDVKFPTHASKYWQAVREMASFYENLVHLSFAYRRNAVEQKQLVDKIASESDPHSLELFKIDLDEKKFSQLNMEQSAKARMREIRLWLQIMEECKAAQEFDTLDVNTHQLVSYGLRFKEEMKHAGNASPAEMRNLVGQHLTVERHIKEQKLIAEKKPGVSSLSYRRW